MKIYIKDNKIVMFEEDWMVLGEQIEGYFGSDFVNLILELLFCLIREFQIFKKWKQKGRIECENVKKKFVCNFIL